MGEQSSLRSALGSLGAVMTARLSEMEHLKMDSSSVEAVSNDSSDGGDVTTMSARLACQPPWESSPVFFHGFSSKEASRSVIKRIGSPWSFSPTDPYVDLPGADLAR